MLGDNQGLQRQDDLGQGMRRKAFESCPGVTLNTDAVKEVSPRGNSRRGRCQIPVPQFFVNAYACILDRLRIIRSFQDLETLRRHGGRPSVRDI